MPVFRFEGRPAPRQPARDVATVSDRHQTVSLAVPQPHLRADVFEGEAPGAHRNHVVLKPSLCAVLERVSQLYDHPGPGAGRNSRGNVDGVEDRVYLSKKGFWIDEKSLYGLLDILPVVLGVRFQHPVRFTIDLRHAGRHVEIRLAVRRRAADHRHAHHLLGQASTEGESVRTAARPTKSGEPINSQMVEDQCHITRVIPNSAAGMRVRQSKTRPVQGDMPHAGLCGCSVGNQAAPWRAVTVNDGPGRGIRIAPYGETHTPATGDLQTIGPKECIHRAESRASPVHVRAN